MVGDMSMLLVFGTLSVSVDATDHLVEWREGLGKEVSYQVSCYDSESNIVPSQ